MLGKTVGKRVEVLKETIDCVIPAPRGFAFCDGYNAFGWKEGAIWRGEILVSEDEDCFPSPVASLGDAEEIEVAYS